MTTLTTHHAPPSRAPVLLLALALAAILFITVAPRMHAVIKHGMEAVAIRQACEQHGPDYVFRSLSPKTPGKFFRVCSLDDGRYGIQIIECTARGWVEKTAFVAKGALGNGTWERTHEYLSSKAQPFKGRLSNACK